MVLRHETCVFQSYLLAVAALSLLVNAGVLPAYDQSLDEFH